MAPPKYTPEQIVASFWAKVDRSGGPLACWLWLAAITNGYGRLNLMRGKQALAHRFSWELAYGPVPEGLYVLHHCDVRNCVNPAHLFLGTYQDNALDMMAKGRGKSQFAPGAMNGEACHAAKLTADDVRAIRRRREEGAILRVIAAEFGITLQNVDYIVRRKAWAHVP